MGKEKKRALSDNFIIGIVFVVLVLFFSLLSTPISNIYRLLLSMTGEVTYSTLKVSSTDGGRVSFRPGSGRKKNHIRKPVVKKEVKPVLIKAPLTKTPEIVLLGSNDKIDFSKSKRFPPLRFFKAETYDDVKTEIDMVIKDNFLYVTIFCEEDPKDIPQEYNPQTPWKFDSIELFLRKEKKSEKGTRYIQYICSAKGNHICFIMSSLDGKRLNKHEKMPRDFVQPLFNSVTLGNGFRINMKIALSNIGVDANSDSKIYMQIVRNYVRRNVCLQLFPVGIYGDSLSNSNHDQRAIREVKIVKLK